MFSMKKVSLSTSIPASPQKVLGDTYEVHIDNWISILMGTHKGTSKIIENITNKGNV